MRRHVRKACDNCRTRKVKCDSRPSQCTNCHQSDLQCVYGLPRAKRGPKPRSPMNRTAHNPDVTVAADSLDISSHHVEVVRDAAPLQVQNLRSGADSPLCVTSSSPNSTGHDDLVGETSRPRCVGSLSGHGMLSPKPVRRAQGSDSCPQAVHETLILAVERLGLSLERTVNICLDLYMRNSFPIAPVIHLASLQQQIPLLLSPAQSLFASTGSDTAAHDDHRTSPTITQLRSYTLLTAICAVTCTVQSRSWLASGPALLPHFLAASRGMLVWFEERDIIQPNSSSLALRCMQSAVLHSLGNIRLSWYVMGDALRLALHMRLFDKAAYVGLDTRESFLRKNLFWLLYSADKSASVLNATPSILSEIYLGYSVTDPANDHETMPCLFSADEGPLYQAPYESRIYAGFRFSQTLWSLAVRVLDDLNLVSHSRLASRTGLGEAALTTFELSIMPLYSTYCVLPDTLPAWLRNPKDYPFESTDEAVMDFHRVACWIQRTNIMATFYCLRIKILRTAFEQNLLSLLGVTSNEDIIALLITEIAHEMVTFVTAVPYEALRAQGESTVEKLRQVGVAMLEIYHQNGNTFVASRAKSLFDTLLDAIARLDSKISDELNGELPV